LVYIQVKVHKETKFQLFTYSLTEILARIWTDISAETETLKMAETDTETDTETEISADILAEADTDTENFQSLVPNDQWLGTWSFWDKLISLTKW